MSMDRRNFLQLLTTGALSAAFPASIAKALSIPAHHRTGTIQDVEHIVFMMQENRSFDHYFGTLRGVRGYGDPRTIKLPSGKPVWYQSDGNGGYVLPFHPGAPDLGLQFIEDLAHDWTTTHGAWNNGNNDQWVPNKGTTTMAHLTRSDIPFHYALADAFTICDAYHCSLLGPTDPNRYYMWSGWVGNDGQGGGPVIDNAEAGYDWSTFPEKLQAAGITWKIYQDVGAGLDAAHSWGWGEDAYIGNYGDNSLLYFHQYQNAPAGSPLANGAKTGTNISQSGTLFDEFRSDIQNGKLPQVSWIAAPEAYTEHPNWPANYGAWYISQMLDALTSNPEVWSKTVFFLMFDENDGFFDHMVPPTPPQTRAEGVSTVDITNEIYPGSSEYPTGPYGLGVRVPMIVISPWSKGGWVSSEVFDHTSMIKFVEKRFGGEYGNIKETNITKWRRAVTGDLTSTLNFSSPNDATVPLPSTVAYVPPDNNRHPDYVPTPPTDQAVPQQESGQRPARPVPYELRAWAGVDSSEVTLHFENTGRATAVFHVRSGDGKTGPWSYTVGEGKLIHDTWTIKANGQNTFDLSVFGPNGFMREFQGSLAANGKANIASRAIYDYEQGGLFLELRNLGNEKETVTVTSSYSKQSVHHTLRAGEAVADFWNLKKYDGWYDLTVTAASDSSYTHRLAGHLEDGKNSQTDPAIAAS